MPNWNIKVYDELPSTQELARQMLEARSARHADVFQALHQTAGRGRYGTRTWLDEPGENLLVSIILTKVDPPLAERIQFLVGIALVRAIRAMLQEAGSGLRPEDIRLKWTNDVLAGGRKIAGILCDAIWSGTELRGIIAGIGINVNQVYFDNSVLRTPATSLKMETMMTFPLESVRERVLAELESALGHYKDAMALMADLRSELAWMKDVEKFDVIAPDGTAENNLRYAGITDDGTLWAVNEFGDTRTFQNATIRL
jgi:BirA family biotin operon repressor/biotin-[acetyl-CoA-carboxylase] ligase